LELIGSYAPKAQGERYERSTMTRIPVVMAMWTEGLLSDEDVVKWADDQIINDSDEFDYVVELSLKGPRQCLLMHECEFPKPRELTYLERFSLKLASLNLKSENETRQFISWVASNALGEDREIPEVMFGYLMDEYYFDSCDISFALKYFDEEIEKFLPRCKEIALTLMGEIE
jgi:hypothetical protein